MYSACSTATIEFFPRNVPFDNDDKESAYNNHHDFLFVFTESYQAPRFITQPTSTKNVIGEGQTKIIQCQALGKCSKSKIFERKHL